MNSDVGAQSLWSVLKRRGDVFLSRCRCDVDPRHARFLAWTLLLGAVLYLAWGFLLNALSPERFDPIGVRLVIGSLAVVFGLIAFHSRFPARWVEGVFLLMAVIGTSHYLWLLKQNPIDMFYFAGVGLLLGVLVSCFSRPLCLTLYALAVAGVILLLSGGQPAEITFYEIACVVTVFLFGILSLVYRLRVIRHLVSTERELGEQRALASVTIKMGELGEVSAGIGHELSSPLMALNGRLALVRKALEASPPDLEKALRHVEDSVRASQRMMMIVRALRTFSRNSEDDPMENASLLRIVQDAHEFAGARQRCRGPLPEIMIEISEELKVRCLPSLLMQVITNLLKNAYDAIEEMPRPWIHLEALPVEPGLVELRITDSGNGIPAEIADRIMRPFFSTKPNGKGTGLGLHLSRRFLERQQGEFFLDRTYPHTRFVVRLPRGC